MAKKSLLVPKRGDVVLVNFDPTIGSEIKKTRPAVVLQNDIGNVHSSVTIVAAVTSHTKGDKLYPTEVFVSAGEGGLEKDSAILLNQIRTIDKQRLIKKIGTVRRTTMDDVTRALEISLGIVEL